uniref:Protein MAK16 homolog n=1 Tax=Eucampia antarctica TaxID=49252 RepID=A0A7S2R596_9STRA|mmetsp:Transcript_17047/g.16475  ORF Transcript_17047/g.16475 Transcript_17047/m.16475 type:complete len:343 (+) Transcript_17047:128-1156(+)
MQHDEMIWQVINNQFCSFKTTMSRAKSDTKNFCRHPYSVTGLCNRTSCPLANSRYATIREEEGKVSLYLKTVERAHSPKNMWEKIYLSRNYSKALTQLDEHLAYFPKTLIHRNKQRLTKIHQYLIRMRKIKLKEMAGKKARMVGINRKIEQREGRREKKALVAAKIEANIEKELLQRLAKGTYGDIYNFPEVPYQKALEEIENQEEEEESEEEESEEEEEMDGVVEYVEDLDEEEESEEDIEDIEYMGDGKWAGDASSESDSEDEFSDESDEDSEDSDRPNDEDSDSDDESEERSLTKKPKPKKKGSTGSKKKKKSGTRVEIEYEEETETPVQEETVAGLAW